MVNRTAAVDAADVVASAGAKRDRSNAAAGHILAKDRMTLP
jgi:hypothetical protein